MKIDNEFKVGVPIDEAWKVLTDLEDIAPCLPGAQLTGVDGDDYKGKVKIKVGPVVSEYTGIARFVEKDDATYHAVIDAKGKDSRGNGNASAVINAQLLADGDSTIVSVDTDLNITGKIAQFGSGMIKEVSAKLLGQFADNLETKLLAPSEPEAAAEPAPEDAVGAPSFSAPIADNEPLDLLAIAGSSITKRLVPLAVAAVLAIAADHRASSDPVTRAASAAARRRSVGVRGFVRGPAPRPWRQRRLHRDRRLRPGTRCCAAHVAVEPVLDSAHLPTAPSVGTARVRRGLRGRLRRRCAGDGSARAPQPGRSAIVRRHERLGAEEERRDRRGRRAALDDFAARCRRGRRFRRRAFGTRALARSDGCARRRAVRATQPARDAVARPMAGIGRARHGRPAAPAAQPPIGAGLASPFVRPSPAHDAPGGRRSSSSASKPVDKPRRVVMLCDVSQSMQAQAMAYFHLMRALALTTDAEVFAFATSLTRLTTVLAHRSADVGDRPGQRQGGRPVRRHPYRHERAGAACFAPRRSGARRDRHHRLGRLGQRSARNGWPRPWPACAAAPTG